jgi:hypothetical protein
MRPLRFFRLEIGHLWALAIVTGVFAFVNTHPIRPHDFWWHLALGREIFTTGEIPVSDHSSFTMAGQPYAGYQTFWLFDAGLYGIYLAGGLPLVVFVHSLVLTFTFGLTILLGRQISGSWRAAAAATFFAAALGIHSWNLRPQSISYLIGAVFLYAIYLLRRKPAGAGRRSSEAASKRIWLWIAVFPLGMLAWANSHGSFPIGLALIGIWLGDETWKWFNSRARREPELSLKPLAAPTLALALAGLACLANPRGFGIVDYLSTLARDPAVQNLVPEWAPPSFDTQFGSIFLLGLLFCAIALILSPRRANFFQLASFLAFALLGLRTARGSAWFGLAMAPVLAEHIASLASKGDRSRPQANERSGSPAINRAFLLTLLLMAGFSLPWFKNTLPLPETKAGLLSRETPVEATRYLVDENLPQPIFNDMSFGSYLIWAAPGYRTFVDTRIELFPPEIWKDYFYVSSALPGWEDLLDRYGIKTLMISPEGQAELAAAAEASPEWRRVHRDQAATIFVKEPD